MQDPQAFHNPLRVATLNIQCGYHFDEALHFLQKVQPDVLCLQEVLESDIPRLRDQLEMEARFSPTIRGPFLRDSGELITFGIAILSKYPISHYAEFCYRGDFPLQTLHEIVPNEVQVTVDRFPAQKITLQKEGIDYVLGNTHFTWSADGTASDMQREDLVKLLRFFDQTSSLIFCGDFNAPRGREIFNSIAARYTDWVPKDINTTLDPKLFRVPGLRYVVDGMFSTYDYQAHNVRVVGGVSDHCAIVGDFVRV